MLHRQVLRYLEQRLCLDAGCDVGSWCMWIYLLPLPFTASLQLLLIVLLALTAAVLRARGAPSFQLICSQPVRAKCK